MKPIEERVAKALMIGSNVRLLRTISGGIALPDILKGSIGTITGVSEKCYRCQMHNLPVNVPLYDGDYEFVR